MLTVIRNFIELMVYDFFWNLTICFQLNLDSCRNSLLEGWVLSQLNVGSVLVKNSPLSVEAQPRISYLIVRTAIPVIFAIRNLYNKVIDLQMMLEPADMFVFAGNKKVSRVRSLSSYPFSAISKLFLLWLHKFYDDLISWNNIKVL